jgi:uncharacterized membrane protein YeaQ/YmgE (transglycosylase-associated protein family)
VDIIGQIIFGLVVGIIAKFLMPGRDPGGFIVTAILGMVGAVVGTFIGRTLWGGENYTAGWITAILGTMLLLALYRITFGRHEHHGHGHHA